MLNPLIGSSKIIIFRLILIIIPTGAFLAGVGQVIITGHITPASIIMPHHHHTVFPREEVAVWLSSVPVLIEL